MLEFAFMRHALLAGFMLSVMIPMIGVVMVNRKTSMIGDSLSHTSLAGVAVGLIFGFNPVIGAILVCILAAFCIERIRKCFPQYGDMATAVITSAGLGVAAVLTKFAVGGNHFESYLFGSISSVTRADVICVAIVFVAVTGASVILYGALLSIAIDVNLARLSGVNTRFVNGLFTLLTAITVALSCKIVGALLVLSILVLPVATSLLICRSYRTVFFLSVLLGILYTMSGIVLSYWYDVPTGGVIVLLAVFSMLCIAGIAKMMRVQAIHRDDAIKIS